MIFQYQPYEIPGEALKLLEKSIRYSDYSDIWELLEDDGDFFVLKTDKIKGVFYLEEQDDTLEIVVLGGEDIHSWKDEFEEFMRVEMRRRGLSQICALGRGGWTKIFKKAKLIGTYYTYT